jgi:hypothetical protein
MFKKVLLGIIAVSAVAMLWTEANAATCLTWRRVGGSNVCTKWSTKGVLLELTFKQDCGPDGSLCEADVFVETENSIAFCVNPANPSGPPSRTTCTEPVTFSGQADECEPKHDKDNDGLPGGKGHDKGHHGCTSTTAFTTPDNPLSCQASCAAAGLGAVVDVVPIEMDTTLSLFVGGGDDVFVSAQAEECPPGSNFCTIQEHCTIDPKRIQFEAIRPYQCDLTSVSDND